jgi:hypothetical protein
VVQRSKGENATVPGHIFFNRSILAGAWFILFNGGAMHTLVYFLPLWFQAIKGVSAVKSGIMTLPMVISLVIAGVTAGALTRRIGYYTPWMILSSILTPLGAGLLTTFTSRTAHPAWIGYQVLLGLGFGLGNQQPSIAAQTVLAKKDVAIGASLMMFCQNLGGAVFISVANNIFDSRLAHELEQISNINLGSVLQTGATDLRKSIPSDMLPQVLVAYNRALRSTFYLVTGLTCLTIFGAAIMEWKSLKPGQQKQDVAVEKEGRKETR